MVKNNFQDPTLDETNIQAFLEWPIQNSVILIQKSDAREHTFCWFLSYPDPRLVDDTKIRRNTPACTSHFPDSPVYSVPPQGGVLQKLFSGADNISP